jgi:hypothetical protein
MTAYGIGLTRAERWGVLHRLFVTQIDVAYNGFQRVVDFMFLDKWECSGNDLWNLVMEKRLKRPLSDHLFALFTSWQSSFAGVTPDFELLFEKFEVLGSLAFFEKVNATEVKAQLAKDPRQGWEWMPIGRAGWNNADGDKIVADLESSALRSALLEAQFANGNSELLDAFIANFNTMRRQLRFW